MNEERTVAASVVLNLYNDTENLLTYTGNYLASYQLLYATYGGTTADTKNIPEEDRKPLMEVSNSLKVLVYRTYVRAKTLAKELKTELPKELTKAFERIIGKDNKRSLTIIYPPDLMNYVENLYSFMADVTVRELLQSSREVFRRLGK